MTMIEADFWCEGDYGDEDGKCSNKKVPRLELTLMRDERKSITYSQTML